MLRIFWDTTLRLWFPGPCIDTTALYFWLTIILNFQCNLNLWVLTLSLLMFYIVYVYRLSILFIITINYNIYLVIHCVGAIYFMLFIFCQLHK